MIDKNKCCKTCFWAEKISDNKFYCAGGKDRFADIVDANSVCDEWSKTRHTEDGYNEVE